MAQPFALPQIPPAGPWEFYISIVIWIPALLRLIMVTKPFMKVVKMLAPHRGWAIKQIKELPIKGMGILAINEILALIIPPLLVLIVRLFADPIGWQTWSETSFLSITVLLLFLSIWIFADFLRAMRTRRILIAISKRDLQKMKNIADTALGIRGWLRRFSGKDKKKKEPSTSIIAKTAGVTWIARMLKLRKLSLSGLAVGAATGVAVEAAKYGAEKLVDKMDEKMQAEFDKISQASSRTLLSLWVRDITMGLGPLIILWLIPNLFN